MNRVSVQVRRDNGDATVCAYFDDWLISQGDADQFEQVVAFANKVARGEYVLDESDFSPFGGYFEMSYEDLDEWYREMLTEPSLINDGDSRTEWLDDAQDFGACDSVMVTLEGENADGVHVHWTDFRLTGEQARVMLTALADMED